MADDDYELIPRKELESLRAETEKAKKTPLKNDTLGDGQSLLLSVNELNNNIRKLIDLFTNTEADLAKEYAEHNPVEDLREIKKQNEQIASAMLALADIVKDLKDDVEKTKLNPATPPPLPINNMQPIQYPSNPQNFNQNPPPNQTQNFNQMQEFYPAPVPPSNIVNQDMIIPMGSGLPPPPIDLQPSMKIGEKKKGFFFKK